MSFRWMTGPRRGAASRLLFGRGPGRGASVRRRLDLDVLEDRQLLAGGLIAQPQSLTTTAGQPVAVTPADAIATFTYNDNSTPVSQFSVNIDWGNGVQTGGFVEQPISSGIYYVMGGTPITPGYTYPRAGDYDVPVTITATTNPAATDTADSSVFVNDTPLTNGFITPFSPVQRGVPVPTTQTVATFSNGNPLSVPSDFLATISWGDGAFTQGQVNLVLNPITLQPTGNYTITPLTPHTYANAGVYDFSVTVLSVPSGNSLLINTTQADPGAQATVTVTQPAIVDVTQQQGIVVSTVAGTAFAGPVAAFTQYAGALPADFEATIDWGDGSTPTLGTVAADALTPGVFVVSGGHTYANFGSFPITVSVVDVVDPNIPPLSGTLHNIATVADAPLTGGATPVAAVAGTVFSGTVATFSTPNLLAQASEFIVTIDWGDGTPLDATTGSAQGGNGNFQVVGQHVYAQPAPNYVTTVTVIHTSPASALPGSSLVVNGAANVIVPVTGQMSRSSDSGPSNTDGITNINQPVFYGTGQPGTTLRIVVSPAGTGPGDTIVGTTTIDSGGNWTVQVAPVPDGSWTFYAQAIDPAGGGIVQTAALTTTPEGGTTLVIDTAGPRVASIALAPNGLLVVEFADDVAGLDPAGLSNPGNYQLASPGRPVRVHGFGHGYSVTPLTPFPVAGLDVAYTSPLLATSTVLFNTASGNSGRSGARTYVVTLNARGLSDLAGNILVETHFVAFPQTTNSPNPNFVASFNVGPNGAVSGPFVFISQSERDAASAYAKYARSRVVVRVPQHPSAFPLAARRVRHHRPRPI